MMAKANVDNSHNRLQQTCLAWWEMWNTWLIV